MSANEMPNQGGGCSQQHGDYLQKAAEACAAGDLVLGMHLYLAAYEKAVADPSIPDGMALAGLREAWHLACDLKERSMAEYVFEKLEPYLMPNEIAECAGELQSMALDRLEQIGFSREDLQGMAEMISHDLLGGAATASVVKVESISLPDANMLGMSAGDEGAQGTDAGFGDAAQQEPPAENAAGEGGDPHLPDWRKRLDPVPTVDTEDKHGGRGASGMQLASVDDFNPYDMYRDYAIGKSWHAATNEGSGAAVFTLDQERAEAHERFMEEGGPSSLAQKQAGMEPAGSTAPAEAMDAADDPDDGAEPAAVQALDPDKGEAARASASGRNREPAHARSSGDAQMHGASAVTAPPPVPAFPEMPTVRPNVFSYATLVGYDEVVSIMRDFGVGLQRDRGYLDFIAMLNEQHGLDRAPALDTILFRAPALEDAARFVEATVGELGLPSLRMSVEESVQGMPVLCITAQGNHRPRMNHANNRFEAPAVLVIEDLDVWMTPTMPEGVEGGMNAFMMANLSRGAREAVNLIRSAVEDPDVFVLATATTSGEVDPFYYEVLEPMTVIDIGYPTDKERADIWAEIARDHPSLRAINRDDLVRYSAGIPRYDLYIAARDALEEAYKLGLLQRAYVPVSPQNIFEKLAACQPLDSDEYREIEDQVVLSFREDLDQLEDLLDGSQG